MKPRNINHFQEYLKALKESNVGTPNKKCFKAKIGI